MSKMTSVVACDGPLWWIVLGHIDTRCDRQAVWILAICDRWLGTWFLETTLAIPCPGIYPSGTSVSPLLHLNYLMNVQLQVTNVNNALAHGRNMCRVTIWHHFAEKKNAKNLLLNFLGTLANQHIYWTFCSKLRRQMERDWSLSIFVFSGDSRATLDSWINVQPEVTNVTNALHTAETCAMWSFDHFAEGKKMKKNKTLAAVREQDSSCGPNIFWTWWPATCQQRAKYGFVPWAGETPWKATLCAMEKTTCFIEDEF